MFRSAPAVTSAIFAVVLACALAAACDRAWAGDHFYSYEATSNAARTLAPTGLTFEFSRHLMGGATVRRIIQTGEQGEAGVKPESEGSLGGGGLKAALGGAQPVGDLYEITPSGDGRAFIQAVCPGSERAWLVIGPLDRFRDLKIQTVGKPAGGPARKCAELQFTYHSEWNLPPDRGPPRARYPTMEP
jgi:hypothetical protein